MQTTSNLKENTSIVISMAMETIGLVCSEGTATISSPSLSTFYCGNNILFIDDSTRSSRRPSSSLDIRTPSNNEIPTSFGPPLPNELVRAVNNAIANQTNQLPVISDPLIPSSKELNDFQRSKIICMDEIGIATKFRPTKIVTNATKRQVSLSNDHYYNYPITNEKSNSVPTSGSSEPVSLLDNYSLDMQRDFRYYFQHPYARILVVYFVIMCNFLIFAEDPVSHSHTESEIPLVGNVFAFILTKYPPELEWTLVKCIFWLVAILTGMVIGKRIIHEILFARVYRLQMFHEEQGSWMVMFLTSMVSLYIFSKIYNTVLALSYPENSCKYQITALMGISNSSLMKAAACGTWLGDFITAWMVTDMMLQDNLYPNWAPNIRSFWRTGNTRIYTFWVGSVGMTFIVISLIVSDLINWDKLNRDLMATTELSRAFLASFILVMDLFIVMQDWDFPHFTSTLDINLPGMKIKAVRLNFCKCPMNLQRFLKIHITGKWFNYGIIFLVMILDLNMWKNQIFYKPDDYGQYLGPKFKIHTVSDQEILKTGNRTLWTYNFRSNLRDSITNRSYREGDMLMNSKYLGYSVTEKCTAFVPSVLGFFLFGLLVCLYGRFPPKDTDEFYGGRLRRWNKINSSQNSWRRERGSLPRQHHQNQLKKPKQLKKSTVVISNEKSKSPTTAL